MSKTRIKRLLTNLTAGILTGCLWQPAVAQSHDVDKPAKLTADELMPSNPQLNAFIGCARRTEAVAANSRLADQGTLALGVPAPSNRKVSSFQYGCALVLDQLQATGFSPTQIGQLPDWFDAGNTTEQARTFPEEFRWYAQDLFNTARLVHGIPETDNQDFVAQCTKGGGSFVWSTPYTAEGFGHYAQVQLSVFAPSTKSESLYAADPVLDEESATYFALATVLFTDPLLTWIARADRLTYQFAQAEFELDLKGSARAVREFRALCAE
ncbi:hypothetical protein [uncultured Ruegeria sp.]|uniref:hypothetical protein n=1 Tax=uncultured Ruegeria sp. TaxID=259304 RepID=UPI00261A1895|nr:hypothetical protein [uncultured Ruegeria sp.]